MGMDEKPVSVLPPLKGTGNNIIALKSFSIFYFCSSHEKKKMIILYNYLIKLTQINYFSLPVVCNSIFINIHYHHQNYLFFLYPRKVTCLSECKVKKEKGRFFFFPPLRKAMLSSSKVKKQE